jgi:hypothetical protein
VGTQPVWTFRRTKALSFSVFEPRFVGLSLNLVSIPPKYSFNVNHILQLPTINLIGYMRES